MKSFPFIEDLQIKLHYVCNPGFIYVHSMNAVPTETRGRTDLSELKLQAAVHHDVGIGNQAWVLGKSRKSSEPLSILSSSKVKITLKNK